MTDPVASLKLTEAIFPRPGTEEPFAVLKLVTVMLQGQHMQLWRAVTYERPRKLIEGGYFHQLEDAARACHHYALWMAVPPVLNETRRLEQTPSAGSVDA